MRASTFTATLLVVLIASCANEPRAGVAAAPPPMQYLADPEARPVVSMVDALHLDLVQRTCAMYVAVRSAAFAAPLAFGNDVEDSMVHWNLCPGGTMVACATVPAANGDSVMVGIPWPYAKKVAI
jgi:hypothetical protein